MSISKKTRNTLIACVVIAVFLGFVSFDVWSKTKRKDTKTTFTINKKDITAHSRKNKQSKAAGPSAQIGIKLKFSTLFPEDLSKGIIPELVVSISNTSPEKKFLYLDHVVLRKTDYRKTDTMRGQRVAVKEIKPFFVNKDQAKSDAVIILPGKKRKLSYDIGKFFTFSPGESDISFVIEPGGLEFKGDKNTSELKSRIQVKIKKGFNPADVLEQMGYSASREVAKVNGIPVLSYEFLEKLQVTYGRILLQQIIAEKLVWKIITDKGIVITEEDIDYAIGFEKRSIAERMKDVPFEEYLTARGLSEEQLRESRGFILRIAIRKFLSGFAEREPSEQDLISFFKEHYSWYGREEMIRARKIVVNISDIKGTKSPGKAREDALSILLELKKQIKSGKVDFEAAVELYSQDVRARVSSGIMDPFRRYSLIRENDQAKVVCDTGFRLKEGEISTPLKIDDDEFMIVQVIDRIPPINVIFKDVQKTVKRDYYYNAISGDQIQKWIDAMIETTDIKIIPEYEEKFRKRYRLEKLKHYETELVEDK